MGAANGYGALIDVIASGVIIEGNTHAVREPGRGQVLRAVERTMTGHHRQQQYD